MAILLTYSTSGITPGKKVCRDVKMAAILKMLICSTQLQFDLKYKRPSQFISEKYFHGDDVDDDVTRGRWMKRASPSWDNKNLRRFFFFNFLFSHQRHHGVPKRGQFDCLFNSTCRLKQSKHQSSAILALCYKNHRKRFLAMMSPQHYKNYIGYRTPSPLQCT